MARASFTLKRYQPLNTDVVDPTSTWQVFGGRNGSGASTSHTGGLFGYVGGESFDILVHASSNNWVPEDTSVSNQILVFSGTLGSSEAFFLSILDDGRIDARITSGSQTGDAFSNVVPFEDGQDYWIKFSFDKPTLTGSFSYSTGTSSTIPTSWTSIGTSESTLSNLSSFTSLSGNHVGIGIYGSSSTAGNNFVGVINRVITITHTGLVTDYYYYTGSTQTWTVPAGVTSVDTLLWGGGVNGGQILATIAVSAGETLSIRVGGQNSGATGGWPNGGTGGTNSATSTYGYGGCGATDIKIGSTVIAVAGGQGGAYASTTDSAAGALGGTLSTSSGTSTVDTPNGLWGDSGHAYAGRGGTQSAAGAAGSSDTTGRTAAPTAGSGQQGGNGASTNVAGKPYYLGGGGGGGYWGGGGGGNTKVLTNYTGHGGGGGSSYINTSRSSTYLVSRRPNGTGSNSWYAAGANSTYLSPYTYLSPLLTNTTDNLSMTYVYGPPQPDYDLTKFDGLVVLRYQD